MKLPRALLGPSWRALGGRLGAQWERERRDTLLLMAAIVLAVLPQVATLPVWCTAGFALLFVWRSALLFGGGALPPAPLRAAAAAICVVAVWAEYGTLLGREAGVALLVLFLGLKLMEMRARRDAFVVVFLCFFLLLTGFFHSQSLAAGSLAAVAVLALTTALLSMQYGPQEAPIGRRFRVAGMLLAQALPVAAILFVLFPRVDGPLWGLPDDARAGRSGLSDTMSPGRISELALSPEAAFRVRFDGEPPPMRELYWRGPVLAHFDGRDWRREGGRYAMRPAPQVALGDGDARRVGWTATLEPHPGDWIYALETAVTVPHSDSLPIAIDTEHQAIAQHRIVERVQVSGSAVPGARIGLNETERTLQPFLQLPAGQDPRTRTLAARWRDEAGANAPAAAFVARALEWFARDAFRYTLKPPLLGQHTVDDFLFDTRAGFCEHYASAFVVLMRALGVPARVVTGYQGGERNPGDDYWIVRQSDAHAWAEVWLEGRGWVRVDPTAAVAPERIEHGSDAIAPPQRLLDSVLGTSLARRWRFGLDSLTHAWNEWVLNHDRERQRGLLDALGLDGGDLRTLVAVLAAALALTVAALAAATLRSGGRRDAVDRAYARFCERLAAIGAPRAPHETAIAYLYRMERLLDPEDSALARDIVSRYNKLRYDPGNAPSDGLRDLERLIRDFKP